ncbi:MAG: hypothetical protein IJT16_02280 [Lachnospiraceae bacterium]|nr:hypothetical protein [Lachnospiraceae bacterium]
MRNIKAVSILIIFEIVVLITIMAIIIVKQMVPEKDTGVPSYVPKDTAAAFLSETDSFERPVDLLAEEEASASAGRNPGEIPTYLYGQFSDDVIEKLLAMSTEQKAAQLLMASPEELTGSDLFTEVDEELEEAFETLPIAGLIFGNENFASVDDTREGLSEISTCSLNATGLLPFLVLDDSGTSISTMSNSGYNMYGIPIGRNDAQALLSQATDNGMLPVYTGEVSALSSNSDYNRSVAIASVESAQEIAESIEGGNIFIYRTESLNRTLSNLIGLIDAGYVSEEELDLAAGHIISLKLVLQDMQY